MSDEHTGQTGGWEPLPQSEGYDGDATAFVQLPPDFMLDGVPLEAPGHGYVPPMITPLQPLAPPPGTDPAATGAWTVHVPAEAQQTQYFEGYEGGEYGERDGSLREGSFGEGPFQDGPFQDRPFQEGSLHGGERFRPPAYVENAVEHVEHVEDPQATAEWRFDEAVAPAADPGSTGQWQIPAVPDAAEQAGPGERGEPDEAPAPAPSYAEAPATLPGGAPAPWALPEEPAAQEPEAAHEAVSEAVPESAPEAAPEAVSSPAPDEEAPAAPVPTVVVDPATTDGATPANATALADVTDSTDSDEHPHTSYMLRVNGTDRPVTDSWIGESLLYVLRERLGLAGAKDGCSQGECGACNVQVDGRLVASCLVPAATAAGSEVRTVEGLAVDGEPSDVQRAMAKCGTVQCGFCIPGMCMTVHDLLEGNHAPTELETRQALAGNLCRCSGYRGVLDAVRDVVAEREAAAAAGAPEAADEVRVPHQIPHPHDGGMA
ncbi:(2Fe-2S)-binding protein [Streptomyces sp. TLI_105]|uniref:(2Fe-2S)-binding protein n=1 Tax=Streptomyces sp. TLI_105 TaxID=1881019 RepID=UPI00089AB813|nr:(2Fe-2S)-binding protein [Streptomyces sp. TLI_105]SED27170.1 Aerobic-type carbon monoxide dehydrogenase, small subunit, CoxS/CutS family [Streptomyces sp. TLI_105]